MKIFKTIILSIFFCINCLPVACGNEQQVIETFSEVVSKCDIGYKVSFKEHDILPFRIEIIIFSKNHEKAISSFRTAPLENINENLAKESRVYFIWRGDNNDKSELWSFAENDGRIRIYDRKAKLGHWVNLGDFLKRVNEKSQGEKIILYKRE